MPQVDKVTFLPIVFWTFILYTGGYLFLSTTFMYTFLTGMKLAIKHINASYTTSRLRHRFSNILAFFPWVSL